MKKARVARILTFVALILFFGIFYIWNAEMVDKRAQEIALLEKRIEYLKFENLMLEARYEKLTSANNVVEIATQKLGMVMPEEKPKEIQLKR